MAKLSLYKEKEKKTSEMFEEPSKSINNIINSKYALLPDTVKQISRANTESHNKDTKYKSRTKFKEGKMRIKQTMKSANDILETMNRLEKISKMKAPSTFIIPLELENKNKRWQDFSHLARRSIFSLKREINLLSVKVSVPLNKLPDNVLRVLASVSRSCLYLLKGLEKFTDEIRIGEKGYDIFREASMIAKHVLLMMAMGNISLPSKVLVPNETDDDSSFESDVNLRTESCEILSCDLNTEALSLLKPKAVRKKLSHLAHSYVARNRKSKRAIKTFKIISPLMKTEPDMVSSSSRSHPEMRRASSLPVIEELKEGRTIQFIHDSLSPKIRSTTIREGKKSNQNIQNYFSAHENRVEPDKADCVLPIYEPNGRYGLSEKMADAFFERILPYVKDSKEHSNLRSSSNKTMEKNSKLKVFREAKRKLAILQQRFERLESATLRQHDFVSRPLLLLLCDGANGKMNLDKVILRGNNALRECSVPHYPSSHPTYSIDTIVDNLRRTSVTHVLQSTTPYDEQVQCHPHSNLPNILEDVRTEKVEFWKALIHNKYVESSVKIMKTEDGEKHRVDSLSVRERDESSLKRRTNAGEHMKPSVNIPHQNKGTQIFQADYDEDEEVCKQSGIDCGRGSSEEVNRETE